MSKLAFSLDLILYPFDLRLSFGETDAQVAKWLSVNCSKEESTLMVMEGSTDGLCFVFKNNVGMIRMKSIPSSIKELGTLQHEITHYVMFLLYNTLNMPHNNDTTEMYAYLTDYITEKIYRRLPMFKDIKNK